MTRSYEHMPETFESTGQRTSTLTEALENLSMTEAEIQVLGRLDSLLPKEMFHGSVSLDARIENGEITRQEHEESIETISKCYVPVTAGAALRCVDGRGLLGFDAENPADYEVGPQIQGGSVDIAVAKRLTKGVESGVSLKDDVKEELEANYPAAPGAHTSVGHENTCDGCGACKGQKAKLEYYQDPAYAAGIQNIVGVLYKTDGQEVPQDLLVDLPKNAANLSGVADEYYADLPQIIEYMTELRGDVKNIKQVLEGVHNEGRVILNFDRNSTLHNSKVNHLTGSKINAFGLDVGYILDQYPQEAPVILADAVATLMNLTDGSIEVAVRLPIE